MSRMHFKVNPHSNSLLKAGENLKLKKNMLQGKNWQGGKNIANLLTWHIKFEKRKSLEKGLNEELILIAWHPTRWQNFRISEDEKKQIKAIFTE